MDHTVFMGIMEYLIGSVCVKGDAMKYFTKDNYIKMQKGEDNLCRASEQYEKYLKIQNSKLRDINNGLHMHDAILLEQYWYTSTLIMKFDISHTSADVEIIKFMKAEIVDSDDIQKGDFWAYKEVYFVNDKFEIHILFCDQFNIPKEMVIRAENVEFQYNNSKRASAIKLKELLDQYHSASTNERRDLLEQIQEIRKSNIDM